MASGDYVVGRDIDFQYSEPMDADAPAAPLPSAKKRNKKKSKKNKASSSAPHENELAEAATADLQMSTDGLGNAAALAAALAFSMHKRKGPRLEMETGGDLAALPNNVDSQGALKGVTPASDDDDEMVAPLRPLLSRRADAPKPPGARTKRRVRRQAAGGASRTGSGMSAESISDADSGSRTMPSAAVVKPTRRFTQHSPASGKADRVGSLWSIATNEEKDSIRKFWRELDPHERGELTRLDKELIFELVRRQRRDCACTMCGRKREAVDEELEDLYATNFDRLQAYAAQMLDAEALFADDAPGLDVNSFFDSALEDKAISNSGKTIRQSLRHGPHSHVSDHHATRKTSDLQETGLEPSVAPQTVSKQSPPSDSKNIDSSDTKIMPSEISIQSPGDYHDYTSHFAGESESSTTPSNIGASNAASGSTIANEDMGSSLDKDLMNMRAATEGARESEDLVSEYLMHAPFSKTLDPNVVAAQTLDDEDIQNLADDLLNNDGRRLMSMIDAEQEKAGPEKVEKFETLRQLFSDYKRALASSDFTGNTQDFPNLLSSHLATLGQGPPSFSGVPRGQHIDSDEEKLADEYEDVLSEEYSDEYTGEDEDSYDSFDESGDDDDIIRIDGDDEVEFEEDSAEDDSPSNIALREQKRLLGGYQILRTFTSRVFEQRIFQAYREHVARQRQQLLLDELAKEEEAKAAKVVSSRKQNKDKKKNKKLAAKQQREEEERRKAEQEREKAEAARLKEEQRRAKQLEVDRLKQEAHRRKIEERMAQLEAESKAAEEKAQADKAQADKAQAEIKAAMSPQLNAELQRPAKASTARSEPVIQENAAHEKILREKAPRKKPEKNAGLGQNWPLNVADHSQVSAELGEARNLAKHERDVNQKYKRLRRFPNSPIAASENSMFLKSAGIPILDKTSVTPYAPAFQPLTGSPATHNPTLTNGHNPTQPTSISSSRSIGSIGTGYANPLRGGTGLPGSAGVTSAIGSLSLGGSTHVSNLAMPGGPTVPGGLSQSNLGHGGVAQTRPATTVSQASLGQPALSNPHINHSPISAAVGSLGPANYSPSFSLWSTGTMRSGWNPWGDERTPEATPSPQPVATSPWSQPSNVSVTHNADAIREAARLGYARLAADGLAVDSFIPSQVFYHAALDAHGRHFTLDDLFEACAGSPSFETMRDNVGLITHVKMS